MFDVKSATHIEKPWGYEEIWASVEDKYLGKYLHINAGESLSRQYHIKKDETVMCVQGKAWIKFLDGTELMIIGRPFHIPPHTQHQIFCTEKPATILEVSTYHPNDVVRLEDKYNRIPDNDKD